MRQCAKKRHAWGWEGKRVGTKKTGVAGMMDRGKGQIGVGDHSCKGKGKSVPARGRGTMNSE